MTGDAQVARYDELRAIAAGLPGAGRIVAAAAGVCLALVALAGYVVARLAEPLLRPTDEPDFSAHLQQTPPPGRNR